MHQPPPAPAHGLSVAPLPRSREGSPFALGFTLVTFATDERFALFLPRLIVWNPWLRGDEYSCPEVTRER